MVNLKYLKEVIEIMNIKDQKKKKQLVTFLISAKNMEAKKLDIVLKRRIKGGNEQTEETHLRCQHCHVNMMKTHTRIDIGYVVLPILI